VRVPQKGYVGVGIVEGPAQAAADFTVTVAAGDLPIFDVAKRGHYQRDLQNDPERCEYFVPVKWLETVSLESAVDEYGFFGNQNTVCKPVTPKWRATVERLKLKFPGFDRKTTGSESAHAPTSEAMAANIEQVDTPPARSVASREPLPD
jgi:hypothetical protein